MIDKYRTQGSAVTKYTPCLAFRNAVEAQLIAAFGGCVPSRHNSRVWRIPNRSLVIQWNGLQASPRWSGIYSRKGWLRRYNATTLSGLIADMQRDTQRG